MYDLLVISLFCNFQDNFEDAETKKEEKTTQSQQG